MDWATRAGKPVVAGPLLDFSARAMPDWMHVWRNDYDTTRDLAYDHLERVVTRYRSAVGIWNIASGLNTCENMLLTPEQMLDLVRMASLLVKQSHRGAKVMVELAEPWGEHCAFKRESMHPLAFVERLVQEGIRIDAVGVQILMGQAAFGRSTRDLMQISMMLDRFFLLERPVIISTLGAPSHRVDARGGVWHEEWSAEHQAKWISRVFAVALSKPFVESIFWTDLFDHQQSELPTAGLISDSGQPKPALQKLVSLRRHLRKPLGPLKLPSRAAATVSGDDGDDTEGSSRGGAIARRGN
jgi:GH35 family endo-1,4-beta-xylanase